MSKSIIQFVHLKSCLKQLYITKKFFTNYVDKDKNFKAAGRQAQNFYHPSFSQNPLLC